MSLRNLVVQGRQTFGKRAKDPSFRVIPAITVIQRYATNLHRGSRVLDIGCRNWIEPELLDAAGLGQITPVDLVPMGRGIRRANVEALPFPQRSFDLVFASHVMEHAVDLDSACREVERVLRPGGWLWIAMPRIGEPNEHDRWIVEHPVEMMARFPLCWLVADESNDREIRLLFQCRKTPRVLLVLSDPLHVRNWEGSGLVGMLKASGLSMRTLHSDVFFRGAPWKQWLRAGLLRTASYAARAKPGSVYAHKLALRLDGRAGRWRTWLRAIEQHAYRLIGPSAERLAAAIDGLIPADRNVKAMLGRILPDVLVVPTTMHEGAETEFVLAAKRAGIPVVAQAATWDTLVTKGGFLAARPDHLLVWGEQSAAHAIEQHGFRPDQVSVTGPPQGDVYAGASDPVSAADRFVFVAGTSIAYHENESDMVRELAKTGRAAGFSIWYRPHPRRKTVDVDEPNVTLDPHWVRQQEVRESWDTSLAGLRHLRWVLDRSLCVVTAFSTLAVEAALFGIPTFLVAFGKSHQSTTGLMDHAAFPHMAEVAGWPEIRACWSMEDLISGVCEHLRAGALRSEPLSQRADRLMRCRDGKARERIAGVVAAIARGRYMP